MQNKNIFYIIIAAIIVAGVWFGFSRNKAAAPIIPEPVSEITYINATADNIKVELPFPDAVVGKEFSVIGEARGTWYFEASFPVQVLDKDGNQLAVVPAQAQGEWMTEDFVPFKADLKIPESYIGPATLVLKKDNPSDMRQYDASISFLINIEY